MADPRFFARSGPFALSELAARCGAQIASPDDGSRMVVDVASLDEAGPDHLTFLDNRKYLESFKSSHAGACIVRPELAGLAPSGMALLLSVDPYRTYAQAAQAFYPTEAPEPGIGVSASIDSSAKIDSRCRIESGAVIGAHAEIGARSFVGPNVVIGLGVKIGEDCVIGASVSISHAIIGNRVNIYPGVRIGQDGFGFAMDSRGHVKVPQLGRVIVEDGVEIGANTTIDRGAGPDTIIGEGSIIDNLVQIGHNVQLGRGCVIVAQVGIAGSAHLGNLVVVGGQVGIAGHLRIGNGVRIAAQSGVVRDIEDGATVGGSPAVPVKDWHRQSVALARLGRDKGR